MRRFVEKCKFISLIAVVSLLVASALAFILGAVKTVKAAVALVTSTGEDPWSAVYFIHIADIFLIATALFVFATSLYELFIGKLDLPDWMVAHNLYELKAKLGSVLVLVMAGVFIEHLVEWKNAQETLFFALAIAVVSAALITLTNLGKSGP